MYMNEKRCKEGVREEEQSYRWNVVHSQIAGLFAQNIKVRWGNLERSLSLAPHTRTGAVRQGNLITTVSN